MVMILPASRGPKPMRRNIQPVDPDDPNYTGARAVAGFFHMMRSKPKASPYGVDKIVEAVRLREEAEQAYRRRWPAPRLVTIDGRPVSGRSIKL